MPLKDRPHFTKLSEFERHAYTPIGDSYDPRLGLPSQAVLTQVRYSQDYEDYPDLPEELYKMCEEKRPGPAPRIFVHTESQLGAMNTQQLIGCTEWG